jgi:hypothetical protein
MEGPIDVFANLAGAHQNESFASTAHPVVATLSSGPPSSNVITRFGSTPRRRQRHVLQLRLQRGRVIRSGGRMTTSTTTERRSSASTPPSQPAPRTLSSPPPQISSPRDPPCPCVRVKSWHQKPCPSGSIRLHGAIRGARNGARCHTDPSRSQPSPIRRDPLEIHLHVAQRGPWRGLRNRRSLVRIQSGACGERRGSQRVHADCDGPMDGPVLVSGQAIGDTRSATADVDQLTKGFALPHPGATLLKPYR